MKRILYLALFALLIGACAQPSCKVQSKAYLEADIELLARFQDTLSLAGSSGPFNLGPVVADMQTLKREHSALAHPT